MVVDGEVGSVGFSLVGVDYGIVIGIFFVFLKLYLYIYRKM